MFFWGRSLLEAVGFRHKAKGPLTKFSAYDLAYRIEAGRLQDVMLCAGYADTRHDDAARSLAVGPCSVVERCKASCKRPVTGDNLNYTYIRIRKAVKSWIYSNR